MAKPKVEDANLVKFGTWGELLSAVRSDYNLGNKEICEFLRCSPDYVKLCVRPWLRHVYVSDMKVVVNDEGDDETSRASSHLRRLYATLNTGEQEVLREDGCTVLYNRSDFAEWIAQHTTVSARTKRIDITRWIKDDEDAVRAVGVCRDSFFEEDEKHKSAARKVYRDARNTNLTAGGRAVLAARVPTSKSPKQVYRREVDPTAKDAPWVPVESAARVDFSQCRRIKEFGVADAVAYRMINQQGWFRVDLTLPDADGVTHTLTYYMPDPAADALPTDDPCIDCFAVLYEVYVKNLPPRSSGAFAEWDEQFRQRKAAEQARAEDERRRREERRRDNRQRAQGIPPRHSRSKGSRGERDKALDQCCAMWRMVHDPAAHAAEGERASAERRMKRLMAKHNISESEVRAAVESSERRRY